MSEETEQNTFSKAVMDNFNPSTEDAAPPKQEDTAPPKQEDPTPPKQEDSTAGGDQQLNFKALRESKKELEQKFKELEATRTDLQSQLTQTKTELETARLEFNKEEFESLKKERETLAMQLAELDVMRSPEVQRAREKVSAEVQNAIKSIRRLIPDSEGLEKALAKEPEERDKAIAAMLEDAPASTASRVWGLVDRVDSAQQTVDEALSLAEGNLSKWKESKQTEAQRAKEQEREITERMYHQGILAAQEEMPELFQIKEGEDTHNKQVSERLAFTKKVLFEPMSEEETVQTAFLAGIGKTAMVREKAFTEALARSEAERQALAEKLKAFEEAEPTGSSGATEGGSEQIDAGFFAKTVLANLGS